MARRSLAILSEGMLSDSQKRSLTLLSLGWIEVTFVRVLDEEDDGRRSLGIVYGHSKPNKTDWREKQLRQEDEEIYAIISTFIQWQA